MKKKLKVLHVASFTGNIGDNANHLGFEKLREMYLDYEFVVTPLEIREMFWGQWTFNSETFIQIANEHELVVFGGGNFFELWVDRSATGTTIDLDKQTLDAIKSPIIFYALGFDLGQGYSESNKTKFKNFMDHLIANSERYFISFRNDGAIGNLKSLYGDVYDGHVSMIPDAGFFAESEEMVPVEKEAMPYVAINLAGDMLDKRLVSYQGGTDKFVEQFAALMDWVIEEHGYEVVFVPHIFRDVDIIYKVIDQMKDKNRRKWVKIASYLTGDHGFNVIHNVYKHADLILANRFHANIFGLRSSVDTIGLVNYPQIKYLYDEVESRHFVDIDIENGLLELRKLMEVTMQNKGQFGQTHDLIQVKVQEQAKFGYQKLNAFIKNVL